MVKQLRQEVAQLLKCGHGQSAFDRVEQLFKDESIVTVYELLDDYCEFILTQLSYIRTHKCASPHLDIDSQLLDCPIDINEAVSSLIFASARCGGLPELPVIRKHFGERYGQGLVELALELLPGNLVNSQIRDNLSIKLVSDEEKHRLVDEIAKDCLPEYEQQKHQPVDKSDGYQVPNIDVPTSYKKYEESQVEAEGKIVHVDFSLEEKKFSTSQHACPNMMNSSTHKTLKEGEMDKDSSLETSYHMPEEIIYLDDIEEFRSPMRNGKDERHFVLKSTVNPTREKISLNDKTGSRSYKKNGKENVKRLRKKRSYSWARNSCVRDVECALYYNDTNIKSNHPRKHHRKMIGPMEMTESKQRYLRAVTMPSERPKDSESDKTLKSNSFPIKPSPPHVHPKLPDYDEVAAKFMALKKANLQQNN
ncbi:hypothetical protein LguiA_013582 [Lonicera macranthoides]